MADEKKDITINFVDNPLAPDLYADDVTGFSVTASVVKITVESGRVDHSSSPGPVNRVVVGRLVMPMSSARNLATQLLNFLDTFEGKDSKGL